MMVDVNEMGTVGSDANLNIVALVDRSAEYGDDPALDVGDWVGAKVLHILPGDTAEELADLGPTDMGDPTTLSTFITYGITNFPAEHYALIISDHGAAWPGVGPDEGAGESVMDLPEVQQALADRPHRCRRRAPRPARLRCLPDGDVRGRQRPPALRRPTDRQLRNRTRHRVGLHRARHARRRPEHHRRRLRRGDRRQLHRQQHSRQHAGHARPRPDAGARRGDGDVLVGAGRADRRGGPRGRPHARRQPGVRQESRSDPGPLHDRPRHADRHDRRRSAGRVRARPTPCSRP